VTEREIRKAAALIAVRDASGGPEVLVIERSGGSRFLPGYISFPGGRTDDDDAGLARRWFGDDAEAARASAVRELLEEVGLALRSDGLRPARHDDVAAIDDAPPEAATLRAVARWIAPEDVPVRFDATYFAVASPRGVEPTPDDGEIVAAWWASPGELLADWQVEKVRLYWPTYFTLRSLEACASVAEVLATELITREPDDDELERLHRSTFWQD
jgi:8-oxo-dGTP pyrophosphatase MutT (NUDIX family)